MAKLTDREIIDRLGGPTKVARLMGLDPRAGGAERVSNWRRRGIPPAVKLQFPHLFLDPRSTARRILRRRK